MGEDRQIKELVQVYGEATTEERAFFGVEVLPSLLMAIESTYGHHAESQEAHPLKLYQDQVKTQHPYVDRKALKNGDILDLLVCVPRTCCRSGSRGFPRRFRRVWP